MAALLRQHLIDPEVCIRCGTCEETCPIDAITHNDDNYVVDAGRCDYCMDCIAPCPTGAIDSWRTVAEAYPVAEQLEWEELPEEQEHDARAEDARPGAPEADDEVEQILALAHAGQKRLVPPGSAPRPRVNLYSRSNPAVATVVGNYRLTDPRSDSDVHHIVLDFGSTAFPVLEGQSVGIIPPGHDERGKPHVVRLYSVASPRDGERPNHNNLALTVKRERFEADGEVRYGVASSYLCGLERGDRVQLTGPFGKTFLMPDRPDANLLMICTGTGSAPFRAMTERRRRQLPEGPGKLLLFFGARTPGELPYHGPLMKLSRRLIDVELAFSRLADKPRQYVQDRMRERAEDIGTLLADPRTHVYVCGLKGMEQGVYDAFGEVCAARGEHWHTLHREMCESGRYHVETY
ncbi:MAG TPA: benzoyl-CoA 2,3-epoxidase subunit BoxA [Gammaproteobacteria bacterium]|nr:benzoyl-CoA 2,3-epoxidase subunit BoxA [Gammaproteobacteria bacterium]